MDDLISRQAAIDALNGEIIVIGRANAEAVRGYVNLVSDRIKRLPSAQPDVPDTNVGDMISRQAAISEIMEDIEDRSLHDDPATPEDYAEGYDEGIRNAAAIVLQMPSAQPSATDTNVGGTDTISRAVVVDAIEGIDWYHQNDSGEMVHGANSAEHQAWYKAEDIYKAIESVPSAQPGWIPVTEKPIEGGQYIVTLKDDKEVWTDIAEWNPTFGGRWQAEFFDCEYCDIDNVLAWQPLPTPYREGGQE